MKKTVEQIAKCVAEKKSERSLFDNLYQEIGDYVFPRKSNVLTQRAQGEDLQVHLYDNTGPQSLELFAGMMMSILISFEEEWFELTTGDLEQDAIPENKAFLQNTTRKLHLLLSNSNFYTEAHEMLLDLGGFGTSAFGIEYDEDDFIRFQSKFIKCFFIGEDAKGKVDELYMEYEYTAQQLAKEYGEKNLPKEVKKCLETGEEKKFKLVHAIYPVENNGKKSKNAKGFKYYSQHVLVDHKAELRFSGYRTFPYPVARYSKATGEKYGRSPAMIALPECKVLNKMVEVTLIGAEKVIDPPLQAPDDGFIQQINTFPAGVSFYRAGSTDRIEPVFNDSRVDFGFEFIREKQQKVKDAFFVSQMMIEPKSGNPVTATEWVQRAEQSMRFMGSFAARMQKEWLQPTIERVMDIAYEKGELKKEDIPQGLRGKNFSVRYTSFIARAQKAGKLQQILRVFQASEPILNLDPSARHYFSSKGALDAVFAAVGAPHEMMNSQEEAQKAIQQEQEQLAQKAQAEAQADQMKAAGAAVRTTGG